MADNSKIEWTDLTWNPTSGCTRVSEGCRNCYIERTPPFRMNGRKFKNGTTGVLLHPDRLDAPLHWKKPRRIFVNSLSDLFHEGISDEFIDHVFATMADTFRHTYQILTKRPDRMLLYLSPDNPRYSARKVFDLTKGTAGKFDCDIHWPLDNVHLGVSVENQETADERIPLLLETPAAVRFISAEPLLGPTDLYLDAAESVDWVIVGGESGPGARPMHPDWARSIRDQCQAAGVPYFFKQWGEWQPLTRTDGVQEVPFGRYDTESRFGFIKKGKKAAGRLLDGREWKEFPQ